MRLGTVVVFSALLLGVRAAPAAEPTSGTGSVSDPNAPPAMVPAGLASPVRLRHAYGLKECIVLAQRNYPKVQEAIAQLSRMRAQVWEARTAPYSAFSATAGVGLAPTVSGTGIYSPNTDVSITSSMALAWNFTVGGAVPLWTFGKISSAIEASEEQVKAGTENVRKAKNEVRLTVEQAFYGVELSRDAQALVNEAVARVDKYLPQAIEKVRSGQGDDIELLKLRIHRAELEARRSEAERQERVALASLRFLTGVGVELDVPDEPLRQTRHSLGPLARYLTAARLFRPEINMAHAGVLARKALLDLERARFYPDLGFALWASRSYAPEVADQLNPFVYDPANYFHYGAGLALSWNLDFLPRAARVAQAAAQLEEIRATERYALGGVGVEVETAFTEAQDAARRLEAYREASQYAKQWLVKVQEGIDVGTFEEEDIVDPAKEYALKRFSQMNATLDYNMALARLALVTGWDSLDATE